MRVGNNQEFSNYENYPQKKLPKEASPSKMPIPKQLESAQKNILTNKVRELSANDSSKMRNVTNKVNEVIQQALSKNPDPPKGQNAEKPSPALPQDKHQKELMKNPSKPSYLAQDANILFEEIQRGPNLKNAEKPSPALPQDKHQKELMKNPSKPSYPAQDANIIFKEIQRGPNLKNAEKPSPALPQDKHQKELMKNPSKPSYPAQDANIIFEEIQRGLKQKQADAPPKKNPPVLKNDFNPFPPKQPDNVALDPAYSPQEVDIGEEGLRTKNMRNFLEDIPSYNSKNKLLRIGNQNFIPVSIEETQFSRHPVASVGTAPGREILILDPKNSPVLKEKYEAMKKGLIDLERRQKHPLTEEQVLQYVTTFVRNNVFPNALKGGAEKFVKDFFKQCVNDANIKQVPMNGQQSVPAIPIDEYIKKGSGVCRHHALVTGYLLDQLSQESRADGTAFLSGKVHQIRANIEDGAHAWCAFVSHPSKKQFHVDIFWNEVGPLSDKNFKKHLEKSYGEKAITGEIQRLNRLK